MPPKYIPDYASSRTDAPWPCLYAWEHSHGPWYLLSVPLPGQSLCCRQHGTPTIPPSGFRGGFPEAMPWCLRVAGSKTANEGGCCWCEAKHGHMFFVPAPRMEKPNPSPLPHHCHGQVSARRAAHSSSGLLVCSCVETTLCQLLLLPKGCVCLSKLSSRVLRWFLSCRVLPLVCPCKF